MMKKRRKNIPGKKKKTLETCFFLGEDEDGTRDKERSNSTLHIQFKQQRTRSIGTRETIVDYQNGNGKRLAKIRGGKPFLAADH
jgi:hypothetical protein